MRATRLGREEEHSVAKLRQVRFHRNEAFANGVDASPELLKGDRPKETWGGIRGHEAESRQRRTEKRHGDQSDLPLGFRAVGEHHVAASDGLIAQPLQKGAGKARIGSARVHHEADALWRTLPVGSHLSLRNRSPLTLTYLSFLYTQCGKRQNKGETQPSRLCHRLLRQRPDPPPT